MPIKLFLVLSIIVLHTPAGNCQDKSISGKSAGATISLPWINNLAFYDYKKQRTVARSGFMGIGIAVFYKQDKQKFSLNFGLAAIEHSPVPFAAIDDKDTGSARDNKAFIAEAIYQWNMGKKINLIGGVNLIRYQHHYSTAVINNQKPGEVKDKTIGLMLGTEYLFTSNFSLAFLYRPALISFQRKNYRHVLSLDARFDLNIWRKNK